MRLAFALAVLLAAFALAAPLAADDDAAPKPGQKQGGAAKKNPGEKNGKAARLPGITAGREAAVMTFVREHHPDLEALLIYLKQNRPGDYEKAFRELFAVSERLARIQEQDGGRYELELARWKLQSRIQLLAARLKMERTDELRQQLREALAEQVDVEIAIAERDRDRLKDRLEKLEARIEKLTGGKQQTVDNQYRMLVQPGKTEAVSTKGSAGAKGKSKDGRSDAKPARPTPN